MHLDQKPVLFSFSAPQTSFLLSVQDLLSCAGPKVDLLCKTMSGNVAVGYLATQHFQPLAELNYGHEFRSKASDSDQFATTFGAIVPINDCNRLRLGYQIPFAGRNAVRSNVFTAGLAIAF